MTVSKIHQRANQCGGEQGAQAVDRVTTRVLHRSTFPNPPVPTKLSAQPGAGLWSVSFTVEQENGNLYDFACLSIASFMAKNVLLLFTIEKFYFFTFT